MNPTLLEQILSGYKLAETDSLYCEHCGKPLHQGESVTVEVDETDDVYHVEQVNCGACDTKQLHEPTAEARLAVLSDQQRQKHYLTLEQPNAAVRTVGGAR